MPNGMRWVGLDVHAHASAVAVFDDLSGEVITRRVNGRPWEVAVLSFTRGVQRLVEQTWELEPLSVRNTFSGLLWIGGLALYLALSGILHTSLGRSRLELSAALLGTPLTAVFLVWGGRVLSAKRIERQDLVPSGILGAVLLGLCSVAATVYVPHLFSSCATRYGVIGVIGAVQRQWDEVTTQTRSRWKTLRLQLQARRRGRDTD